MRIRKSLESRLRSFSRREGECLIWTGTQRGGVPGNRYGALKVQGAKEYVHRMAYELWVGPVPEGQLVCHTCDVRLCIEPSHLFLGTQKDNAQDRDKKGRAWWQRERGTLPSGDELFKADDTYRVRVGR